MNLVSPRLRGARRLLALCGLVLGLGVLTSSSTWAQTDTASAAVPAKKPPPGFEPVAGARTENVSASLMVVLAYATFFSGILAYVVIVVRKQTELGRELAEVARRIDRASKS